MKVRKSGVKVFILGFLLGGIFTVVLLFGAAAVSVLRERNQVTVNSRKQMTSGYLGDTLVEVVPTPQAEYDWSLDISYQGTNLIQVGKLVEADGPDRCQVYDHQGRKMIYMVWKDPEADPGFLLYNQRVPLASLTLEDDGEARDFWYGPYGLSDEDMPEGASTGFRDLDYDGQFDLQDIFRDGQVQQGFIWFREEWLEIDKFDIKRLMAHAVRGEEMVSYVFRRGEGWQLLSDL